MKSFLFTVIQYAVTGALLMLFILTQHAHPFIALFCIIVAIRVMIATTNRKESKL